MPRAFVLIRDLPLYRAESFRAGLAAAGFTVPAGGLMPGRPSPGDVLVCWNRYATIDRVARQFEDAGGRVLIAENAYLGRDWRGGHWYAMAWGQHNGAGAWPDGGPQRWDSWGVPLPPMRVGGREIVILATRGIGPDGVREPPPWLLDTQRALSRATRLPVRVRRHPGEGKSVDLARDLEAAAAVVTWGSGAALKALLLGVPVLYGFPRWIGAAAGIPLAAALERMRAGEPPADEFTPDGRLAMFRRLAWAQWNTGEIASGEAFRWLLK